MVGTGLGARRGILIKNGEALERGRHVDVVVFDKTGTLTEGRPSVAEIVSCAEEVTEADVLRATASLEALSEHPLAQAIVLAARDRQLPLAEVSDFESIAGKGVRGRTGSVHLLVGSPRFLEQSGVPLADHMGAIAAREARAQTVVAVARAGALLGFVSIADAVKGDAAEAIARLHAQNIETALITGDNHKTATALAALVGIKQAFAEVLPQDKADQVGRLQAGGKRVAFVGDGINDAPALAKADLGIAMGTGTDVAIEAGNIVLVKGHPLKVIEALALSRVTFRTIKQNLFWAFFYNVAALPLAAFGLLNPMVAAAAMALSSVSVVGNSLRIRRQRIG
jgi:heavy metal translocating P-type ATPase